MSCNCLNPCPPGSGGSTLTKRRYTFVVGDWVATGAVTDPYYLDLIGGPANTDLLLEVRDATGNVVVVDATVTGAGTIRLEVPNAASRFAGLAVVIG